MSNSAIHSLKIIPAQCREIYQACQQKGFFKGCRDKIRVIGTVALKTLILYNMADMLRLTATFALTAPVNELYPTLGVFLALDAISALITYIALRRWDSPHKTDGGREDCQFRNVCDLTR